MGKERSLRMSEAIRRITEAKKHLKAGNLEKAADTTPCEGCQDKLRQMKKALETA